MKITAKPWSFQQFNGVIIWILLLSGYLYYLDTLGRMTFLTIRFSGLNEHCLGFQNLKGEKNSGCLIRKQLQKAVFRGTYTILSIAVCQACLRLLRSKSYRVKWGFTVPSQHALDCSHKRCGCEECFLASGGSSSWILWKQYKKLKKTTMKSRNHLIKGAQSFCLQTEEIKILFTGSLVKMPWHKAVPFRDRQRRWREWIENGLRKALFPQG